MSDQTQTPEPEHHAQNEHATFFAKLDHQLRMRPRSYFIIKNICIAVGISLVAALVVFALGNALFLWKSREIGTMFGAGGPAPSIAFRHFPWEAAGLSFIGVVGLLFLLRHFSSGYRWPSLFLLSVVLLGGVGLAIGTTFTPLHGTIANRALRPDAPRFFQHTFRPDLPDEDATLGEISSVASSEKFTIITRDGTTMTVTLTDDTTAPPHFTPTIGQRIIVFGTVENNSIAATAIGGGRGGRMMQPQPYQ
jgi:hypothetical protein